MEKASTPAPKIVIIGAGSASFGPTTLATIIRHEALHSSKLALVDINEQSLETVRRVADKMNECWRAGMTISADTDRRCALPGADFVVVSIEVPPRETLWRMDWEIPLRHGLRQPYAENGGPGGLMHACRQVPPLMEIAADMEALCPAAWMINFSNPLPRLTRAVAKYSGVRVVGKCHQINVGYALAAALLRDRYGIRVDEEVNLHSNPANVGVIHSLAAAGRQHFTLTSAGLNHFIWLLDIRDRITGEDLYPALRDALDQAPPTLEPLSLDLFRIFGLCPIPGDTHLAEYTPWMHDPIAGPWDTYRLPLYDWDGNESVRQVLHQMLQAMAADTLPVDGMREAESEGAAELIAALSGRDSHNEDRFFDETVNIPNNGAIANLADETIVEVPALIGSYGIRPLQVGGLPEPIAELCRREAALVEMVVDTAVSGDRRLALQTLLLDPMINDIGRARAILDDYLRAFAPYLPQFQ